jgi:hypothetical protein
VAPGAELQFVLEMPNLGHGRARAGLLHELQTFGVDLFVIPEDLVGRSIGLRSRLAVQQARRVGTPQRQVVEVYSPHRFIPG